MKRFIAFLITILLIVPSIPVINTYAAGVESGYELIGDTSKLELYYNDSVHSVAVKDKRYGYIWYSCVDKNDFDIESANRVWKLNIQSLFNLGLTELTIDSAKIFRKGSAKLDAVIESERIDNGIRLKYTMEKMCLELEVELKIEDDSLIFNIPKDSIKEKIGLDEKINSVVEVIYEKMGMFKSELNKAKMNPTFKVECWKDSNLNDDYKLMKRNIRLYERYIKKIDGLNNQTYADNVAQAQSYINRCYTSIAGGSEIRGILDALEKLEQTDGVLKITQTFNEMSAISKEIKDLNRDLSKIKASGVVTIEALPYLGASGDFNDGYIFYPDGCGALSYFKENHPKYFQYYHKDIYTDDMIELDEDKENNGRRDSLLPVYGIKKNNGAFIGIATQGDNNASVNYYPSGYQVALNRAGIEFRYRREYSAGHMTKLLEKNPNLQDNSVRITFIDEDKCDYSGMATTYRDYLIKNNLIKQQPVSDKIPLGLDFFMGIEEQRIIFNKFIAMTTFDQVQEIIDDLESNGIDDMNVNLKGWMNRGYGKYPSNYQPATQIGGKDGLEKLADYLNGKDIDLYLEQNLIEADKRNGGFTIGTDAIKQRNSIQVSDPLFNLFLLTPNVAYDRFINNVDNNLGSYGIRGITFERIGNYIYYDYDRGNYTTKKQTVKVWDDILTKATESFGGLASRGGNAYMLKQTDWLLDIPTDITGYFFTDEQIPFYQLVVHGVVPYSTTPFNLFYNHEIQKLKAIEYGSIPTYQLTYKPSSEMRYTDYTTLFSSEYNSWKQDIIDIYTEYKTRIGSTFMNTMVSHKKIREDIYEVIYSDGTKLLFNYTDTVQRVDGYEIEPINYLVISKGGEVR